ncbi:unnamed protein product, partial [Ascophyllum nodosum]
GPAGGTGLSSGRERRGCLRMGGFAEQPSNVGAREEGRTLAPRVRGLVGGSKRTRDPRGEGIAGDVATSIACQGHRSTGASGPVYGDLTAPSPPPTAGRTSPTYSFPLCPTPSVHGGQRAPALSPTYMPTLSPAGPGPSPGEAGDMHRIHALAQDVAIRDARRGSDRL